MFGRTAIFAIGLGFGMLVFVMALLSSGSITHAGVDPPGIYAYVDYDCQNCSYTWGDSVYIYWKANRGDDFPEDPTYKEPILLRGGQVYKAIKLCPINTGYYLVRYRTLNGYCQFQKTPLGSQYMDCSVAIYWHNDCREVHP